MPIEEHNGTSGTTSTPATFAIWGDSGNGVGVFGSSGRQAGVFGSSGDAQGVEGQSKSYHAIHGVSSSTGGHAGVYGEASGNAKSIGVSGYSTVGTGVFAESDNGFGLRAKSHNSYAIEAASDNAVAIHGISSANAGIGIYGECHGGTGARGVSGYSVAGIGIHAESSSGIGLTASGGTKAADFSGDVEITGNLTVTKDIVLVGADCAEEFDTVRTAQIEPGTVMVLDQQGALQHCEQAYDKRAAGVISGAGDYQPALILDRQHTQESRVPLALVGKVYCKVDAQYAPIEVGDLLTTSPTPGHAMKADDPAKAFGSVIGKALRPLNRGQELLPILIALQ